MKVNLKWTDRLLLALYALLGIVATVLIALAMCSGMQISLLGYTLRLGDGVWPMVIMAVIAAVLLVWSIRLIVLSFRREPKLDKGSVSVQNTENGAVRISVQAMDTLVKQAIGEADGVEDIRTSIVNHEDSISVNIDMTLRSDVHIPNVTMLMQRSIKNFIEEFSGIAVRDVTVMVSRIVEVAPPAQLDTIEAEPPKAVEAPRDDEALANPAASGEEAPLEAAYEPDIEPDEPEPEPLDSPDAVVPQAAEREPVEAMTQAPEADERDQEEPPMGDQAQEGEGRGDEDKDEEFNEKDIW